MGRGGYVQIRLPSKYNLFERGCLRNNSILCSTGYTAMEDVHQLFVKYLISGAVLNGIIFWLRAPRVLLDNAFAWASQFSGARDFCKSIRSCFQTIWLVTVWSIWNERNSRVFNRKEMSIERLVYNIKINVLWWLKIRKKKSCFDLNH
jgi:hypothetical protein